MITKEKNRGITLISLIVTIIILLILASVSIAMLTGENGIIIQANKAKEQTIISTEKEAIQLMMINKEVTGEEKYKIGEELIDKELANGDRWKIVYVDSTKTIYGTGWNYVEEGIDLENYGETKYKWVINYNTGEVVQLPKEGTSKFQYGDNLAVKDGLILNADPINMSDENSWGDGVTVYGIEEDDGYGWNNTEFKLDGIDDYIEVYPQENINIENGLTFEFYGKTDSISASLLAKTLKNDNNYVNRFRTIWENDGLSCCMSGLNSDSDLAIGDDRMHWIRFDKNIGNLNENDGGYLTLTIDFNNCTVKFFWNGKFIISTICNHDWMLGGEIANSSIPFTIGLMIGGNVYTEQYGKLDIYACRLYNKILTDEEVKNNCEMTVNYHNMLVNQKINN